MPDHREAGVIHLQTIQKPIKLATSSTAC